MSVPAIYMVSGPRRRITRSRPITTQLDRARVMQGHISRGLSNRQRGYSNLCESISAGPTSDSIGLGAADPCQSAFGRCRPSGLPGPANPRAVLQPPRPRRPLSDAPPTLLGHLNADAQRRRRGTDIVSAPRIYESQLQGDHPSVVVAVHQQAAWDRSIRAKGYFRLPLLSTTLLMASARCAFL